MTSRDRSRLFPGERIRRFGTLDVVLQARKPERARQLVVFLPGGGHLARIAYGHPGCHQADFLGHWLCEAGYAFLALSYPGAHPLFIDGRPDLTMREWTGAAAQATRETVAELDLSDEVIAVGWSMGGAMIPAFARAAATHGLTIAAFIALAALPPLPGLMPQRRDGVRLNDAGYWDISYPRIAGGAREEAWRAQLAEQDRRNGRTIIPPDVYARHYRIDHSVNLIGEIERFEAGGLVHDSAAAIEDLASLAFPEYPWTGTIAPGDAADWLHALTDEATWAFVNTHKAFDALWRRHRAAPPQAWPAILSLMRGLPQRLSRTIDGNHFFFVGEIGARATAAACVGLVEEIRAVVEEIEAP